MSDNNQCKGCIESVIVTDEVIEELIKDASSDLSKVVTDEEYQNRLNICNQCSSLLYRTTCAYSGNIVRYSAKFKHHHCPSPKGAKWERVEN